MPIATSIRCSALIARRPRAAAPGFGSGVGALRAGVPQVSTRSIVNRVLAEWKGKEDKTPAPAPLPAVVGTARLQPWSVPGGIPYAMPKFSVIIPTRDSTGDFDELGLLTGADSAPLIKAVKPAAAIVAEVADEAAALWAARRP